LAKLWQIAMASKKKEPEKEKREKGVTEVRYYVSDGEVEVVKYRVRIKRKDIVINELVDSLEDANEIARHAKSKKGKSELVKAVQTEQEKDALDDLFNYDPTKWKIRYYLARYYEENLKRQTDDKKALFNNSVNKAAINAICETEIADVASIHESGRQFLQKIRNSKNADFINEQTKTVEKGSRVFLVETGRRVKFGDVDITDINTQVIKSFVDARKAGVRDPRVLNEKNKGYYKRKPVSMATIKKNLQFIRSAINKLAVEPSSTLVELAKNNPVSAFLDAVKNEKAYKSRRKKIQRRLDGDEEKRLYGALQEMRNPAMLLIAGLAHHTGMRRSEILGLTHRDLAHIGDDEETHFIKLIDTKNGDERMVLLTPDAVKIVKSIEKGKADDEVFPYTYDGFNANIKRAFKKAKIEGFTFHMLRGEFISKLLDEEVNEILAGQMVGYKDQAYFEKTFLPDKSKAGKIRRQVGHKDKNVTTHHYLTLNPTRAKQK